MIYRYAYDMTRSIHINKNHEEKMIKIIREIEDGIEDGIEIQYGDNGFKTKQNHISGTKYWYLNNQYHRTDGPAIELADGDKSWYINGVEYSEEDFDMAKQMLWAV